MATEKAHTKPVRDRRKGRNSVGLRARPDELEVLDKAADVERRSRTEFVLFWSTKIAERIIAGKPVTFQEN